MKSSQPSVNATRLRPDPSISNDPDQYQRNFGTVTRVPDTQVAEWFDSQALATLYLSAITVAELRFGVQSLPVGRRRSRLHEGLELRILPMFAGRVLAFDLAASQAYADLMAKARSAGRAVSASDGYIAAIAAANGMLVATRDTSPFEAAGLKTVDPWGV